MLDTHSTMPEHGSTDATPLSPSIPPPSQNADVTLSAASSSPDSDNDSGNALFAQSPTVWTDVLPRTAHVRVFLECDRWPPSVGPIVQWSQALRLYTTMLFADSRGAILYWGPERVAVYNEKLAVDILGDAHPHMMGRSSLDVFPAVGDSFNDLCVKATSTGQAVELEDMLFFPHRHGYLEETYFRGQLIPLRGDSGRIEGFYNPVFETTDTVLRERRRRIIDEVAAIPRASVKDTLSDIVNSLHNNPNDIPMAMLYSLDEVAQAGDANLHLYGTVSVPPGHKCAPQRACLETDQAGLIPYFRQAESTRKPVVLSRKDGTLNAVGDLFDGLTWRGFGEQTECVVILLLSSGNDLLGFYVQGTNSRRAYDELAHRSTIELKRQIEVTWAAALSSERAKVREEALERRATDSENRLHHMAKHAPIGMIQITPERNVQWANDQYYEITGHDRADQTMEGFFSLLAPSDSPKSREYLTSLLTGSSRTLHELCLSRKWTPPTIEDEQAEESHAWLLAMGFPSVVDGKVDMVMGYVSDISHQKWAESVQTRNATAAISAKRRQENFIDTTSHEMRNPLTAITQLADGIAQSLPGHHPDPNWDYLKVAEENVDAANTILACAAHQKRVIDDVLILSRLESDMLSITPVVERPGQVVSNTIKMFEGETKMNDITLDVVRDASIDTLNVDRALVDTSRLAQVLINLISNAIKFTAEKEVRRISVKYGAQMQRPPNISCVFGELEWTSPLDPNRVNVALPPLCDNEKRLYLYFAVEDTGTGMMAEETTRLFQRFSQGSSKTHVAYGGSGLGLYICRELAEKQGGRVGVASSPGRGSVFAFYIETRPAASAGKEPGKKHARHVPISEHAANTSKSESQTDAPGNPSTAVPSPSSGRQDVLEPEPRPYNVLVVEDNVINQRVLAKQLRSSKCIVNVANNGVEALEVLQRAGRWELPSVSSSPNLPAINSASKASNPEPFEIDVVLLDWEMPMMNGLDCCRHIRAWEEKGSKPHLPVIAITANVRQEQKDAAVAAGMDRVLSKPFVTGDVLNSIRAALASQNDIA